MMKTKVVKFSTRIMKKLQADTEFSEFRDPSYPIRLRFHQNRNKATWFFVQSVDGKVIWKKISYWPTLNFDDIRSNLSAYQTKFNLNPRSLTENGLIDIISP